MRYRENTSEVKFDTNLCSAGIDVFECVFFSFFFVKFNPNTLTMIYVSCEDIEYTKIYRFSQFDYHNCHDENWCDQLNKNTLMRWGFFLLLQTHRYIDAAKLDWINGQKKETIYFNWAWLDLNANWVRYRDRLCFFDHVLCVSEKMRSFFIEQLAKKNIFGFNDSIVSDNCLSAKWEAVSCAYKVLGVWCLFINCIWRNFVCLNEK